MSNDATTPDTRILFDVKYVIDNTDVHVLYTDNQVSLNGDHYVMLFHDAYMSLVKPLNGHQIKLLFELGFDILKDTGNLVSINKQQYADRLQVDTVSIYHYIAELKRAGVLRKVKGMGKVYEINPKVLWRKTLKERQQAIEQWDQWLMEQRAHHQVAQAEQT